MKKLFDAHTHVNFAAFKDDWRETIQRALDADVGLINVGTQQATSKRAIEIADEFEHNVYAVIGLHPIHTTKSFHDEDEVGGDDTFTPLEKSRPKTAEAAPKAGRSLTGFTSRGESFDYNYYKELARHPKVVAIGECGLDYYRNSPETSAAQEKAFREHIRLAHDVQKPLMIHCRPSKGTDDAYERLLEIVNDEGVSVPLISHFYAGSPKMTQKLLDRGFYFTFGGVITFVRDYDAMIDLIPLERMMLETDAPYVTPTPHRGKRNEPLFVQEVAKKMAQLKGVDYDTICTRTTNTVQSLFKIS